MSDQDLGRVCGVQEHPIESVLWWEHVQVVTGKTAHLILVVGDLLIII